MPMAHLKKIISLLLIVAIAYASYTLLQMRLSVTSGPQRGGLVSLPRHNDEETQGTDGAASYPGLSFAFSADGAPVDVRSNKCRRQRYANVERLTATVVVDVPSTGVDVKKFQLTVDGLLAGERALVDEVIVVADGLHGPVAVQLEHYLTRLGVAGRLVRNAGIGRMTSRVVGSKLAKSPVMVFADWRVVATVGWLRPLLDALTIEPNSIVMPHLDDASSDPTALATTPERLVADYVWPLSVRMVEYVTAMPTPRGLYRTPALRGDLLAVRRDFWDRQLGGYDWALGADSAAANLELSIRAWQCHGNGTGAGAILVHRCSHIGVRNLSEVMRVVEPNSVKHIARLWFGNRRRMLERSVGVFSDVEGPAPADNRKYENCSSIDTYFNDIAVVPVPSTEAVRFGQLQAYTSKL